MVLVHAKTFAQGVHNTVFPKDFPMVIDDIKIFQNDTEANHYSWLQKHMTPHIHPKSP